MDHVTVVDGVTVRAAPALAVDEQTAAHQFVPKDTELANALKTAETLAIQADEKFCAAFGGDGETTAYWLSAAIAEIRAALYLIEQRSGNATHR